MPLCNQCDAIDEYKVVGLTDTFTFSFDYVLPDDVNIAVRDRFTREFVDIPRSAWTFENLSTIKITPPPQADVAIYRCTNVSSPAATFFPGNSIKAEDLNANQAQVLNAINELRCALEDCCNGGGDLPGIGEPCSNGQCANDLICVDGICLPPCNNGQCPTGYTCVEGICFPDCTLETDCPAGFTCVEGVCLPECDDDGICPTGFKCVQGICLPDCSDDGVCPTGFTCVDGTCLPDCSDDGVCPDGFVCVDGVCQPDELTDAPSDGKLYGRQDAKWELAIPYDLTLLTEIVPPNETQPAPTAIGETAVDLQDAPSDGKLYGRIDATWSTALLYNLSELPPIPEDEPDEETGETNVTVQAIGEAPVDGSMYGRKDGTWSKALQQNLSELTQLPEGTTPNV